MIPAPPDTPLTDGVVTLAPLTFTHVQQAGEICDIEGVEAIEPGIPTRSCDDITFFFNRAVIGWQCSPEMQEAVGARLAYGFAVAEVDEPDELAAIVGFQQAPFGINIFYWTAPTRRGRGIAPRAVVLATAWAFDAFDTDSIYLRASSSASESVARKAGYVQFDTLIGKPLFRFAAPVA